METPSLVTNQRGNKSLDFKGYRYFKNKSYNDENKVITYWVCQHRMQTDPFSATKKKRQVCSAVCHTIEIDGELRIKKEPNEHTCTQTSGLKRSRENLRLQVKEIAATSTNNPSAIIQNFKSSKTLEELELMPKDEALRRCIQRAKKQNQPPELVALSANIVLESMKKTIGGDIFFREAIVRDGCHSFVFASERDIQLLEESPFWLMDGTFKTVPHILYQLYTIHGRVGRSDEDCTIVPLVYILMDSKNQKAYEDVFSYISSLMTNIQAQVIVTDFELAAIKAVKSVFPEVPAAGCYFHLQQCFLRHMKSCGLQTTYANSSRFGKYFKMLGVLAFLKAEEIPLVFEELKLKFVEAFPDSEKVADLLNYISLNFIGWPRDINNDGVISFDVPRFPPELWSVNQRTNLGFPRTQNNVESWNNRWKHLLGTNHVGVHRCIDELRKEQHNVSSKVHNGLMSGFVISAKKKLLLERENALREFLRLQSEMTTFEFVEALTMRIHGEQ